VHVESTDNTQAKSVKMQVLDYGDRLDIRTTVSPDRDRPQQSQTTSATAAQPFTVSSFSSGYGGRPASPTYPVHAVSSTAAVPAGASSAATTVTVSLPKESNGAGGVFTGTHSTMPQVTVSTGGADPSQAPVVSVSVHSPRSPNRFNTQASASTTEIRVSSPRANQPRSSSPRATVSFAPSVYGYGSSYGAAVGSQQMPAVSSAWSMPTLQYSLGSFAADRPSSPKRKADEAKHEGSSFFSAPYGSTLTSSQTADQAAPAPKSPRLTVSKVQVQAQTSAQSDVHASVATRPQSPPQFASSFTQAGARPGSPNQGPVSPSRAPMMDHSNTVARPWSPRSAQLNGNFLSFESTGEQYHQYQPQGTGSFGSTQPSSSPPRSPRSPRSPRASSVPAPSAFASTSTVAQQQSSARPTSPVSIFHSSTEAQAPFNPSLATAPAAFSSISTDSRSYIQPQVSALPPLYPRGPLYSSVPRPSSPSERLRELNRKYGLDASATTSASAVLQHRERLAAQRSNPFGTSSLSRYSPADAGRPHSSSSPPRRSAGRSPLTSPTRASAAASSRSQLPAGGGGAVKTALDQADLDLLASFQVRKSEEERLHRIARILQGQSSGSTRPRSPTRGSVPRYSVDSSGSESEAF